MTKWINSPLEEIDNSFLWPNTNIEFEKTLSNNFGPLYDNGINGDDTESKIYNSLKNENQFIHSDEPFKKTTDTTDEKILNNKTLLPINNIFFNSIKYDKNNSMNMEKISDTPFEESFQEGFTEWINDSLDIDYEKIFFLPYKKKNIVSLNKIKKKQFLIKKVNKVDKEKTNSTNEKTNEKKESGDIAIIIVNKENTEKKDINFIGKKRKIFKVISERRFNIFNYGEYDDYSKRMINEALNENNKQRNNLFDKIKFKYSKKTKKIVTKKHRIKFYTYDIRKKIKSRFHKYLKNIINEKLKLAGSIYFFEYLPQSFITNTTKKYNISFLNLTLEEILKTKLFSGKDNKESALEKYFHNLLVLNYLEKNKEISRKSNFNNIKKMKLFEIYDEYINSKEFKMDISKLKQQNEDDQYIKKYIIKAINLIDDFFC